MPPPSSMRQSVSPPSSLRSSRPRFRAARAFYLTLLFGTCFATYALWTYRHGESPAQQEYLHTRSLDAPVGKLDDDDRCRLVHRAAAKDQCAYIRSHCPDDEGGFTAYLELYYCKLPHAKPVAFTILISWLGLLFSTIGIAASDFFCIDLSTIAAILGMSESMAGVTFLAFGNGSPDVFSTFAAMSTNSGSLALGELFGAAGFITAVVSGSMALIRPFHVARKSFIRDVVFFIVAAAFSLGFIWDGRLHLWECLSMVAYYIFYVSFVVFWHWWLGRRRRRREKEAAARGQFIAPEDELAIEEERYLDDPDEMHATRRFSIVRTVSREDWSALERGGDEQEDEDDEEEARDRWMSELASNMRLTRPARSRGNTVTPVRPSLVGALEFQAVLKSLQRSRNFQTIPMHARRYSDDPYYTTAQQQDAMSTYSDPASRPPYEINVSEDHSPTMERATLAVPLSAPLGRSRAVSANGAENLRIDPDLRRQSQARPQDAPLISISDEDVTVTKSRSMLDVPSAEEPAQLTSPTVRIEPATPRRNAPINMASPDQIRQQMPNRLAPPGQTSPALRHAADYFAAKAPSRQNSNESGKSSPQAIPKARRLPKIVIPGGQSRSRSSSRAPSPIIRYKDSPSPTISGETRSPVSTRPPSIYLPSPLHPIASPESLPASQGVEQQTSHSRPTKWWPYSIMPPPGVIISSLFPTIYHWADKTWWEKCLGLVAAPSVFLLTITLPVVENDKDAESDDLSPVRTESMDALRSKSIPEPPQRSFSGGMERLLLDGVPDNLPGQHRHSMTAGGMPGLGGAAAVATHAEQHIGNYGDTANSMPFTAEPLSVPEHEHEPSPALWNRWLTVIQLFLAPLLIVLSIYIQAPSDMSPSWLLRPTLISLLVSTTLLIPFLLTTTPTHRPAIYRILLSLAGFVVSIAWISAIAAQVVGALKALAVILNMSHAIMGLTIFAVGNSLGDLVADVTVARLGYPVMALSACFGGPMLNILLGVGLSGSYQLIHGAEKRRHKHPGEGLRFKVYHIEVSRTLIISGFTLLVTLLAVLVFVPLNKWVFSKRIGLALMVLWTLSTVGNVVVEVTGWGVGGSE